MNSKQSKKESSIPAIVQDAKGIIHLDGGTISAQNEELGGLSLRRHFRHPYFVGNTKMGEQHLEAVTWNQRSSRRSETSVVAEFKLKKRQ